MEMPSMPMPLMLGGGAEGNGCGLVDGATPFRLPKLGVFGEKKGRAATKREEIASEDEEDPREEAQMIQLLHQMQKVKENKENKRKRDEIAARTKVVAGGVRRHVSKRIKETKSSHDKLAADLRCTMEALRVALNEETKLAAVLLEEQQVAMKAAVNALNEKYDQAAEVRRKVKLLGDCMHEHFQVVRAHVATQVDNKIAETEEAVQGIYSQPNSTLSIIGSAGKLL